MLRFVYFLGLVMGIFLAIVSLVFVVLASPLVGMETDLHQVFLWSTLFLVGIFLAGWGLGRVVTAP